MRLSTLAASVVPLVLLVSACSPTGEKAEASAEPATQAAQSAIEPRVAETQSSDSLEPCFTVPDVGTELSLTWELVVAAQGAPDQQDYIDDLMDDGEDLFEEAEDKALCAGYQEIADFNYDVALLNMDIRLGSDTPQHYEDVAEAGNSLLDLSDDEGYEWDYEFVTSTDDIGG